jgi:hypothetical protein
MVFTPFDVSEPGDFSPFDAILLTRGLVFSFFAIKTSKQIIPEMFAVCDRIWIAVTFAAIYPMCF